MNDSNTHSKALFLASNGQIYPDYLICSGALGNEKPCEHSDNGRMPDPIPLDPQDSSFSLDRGNPGDLCPPCAKQQLANLEHWQGHGGQTFPPELLPLRLFKCRMWLWLVIPGLSHLHPSEISRDV